MKVYDEHFNNGLVVVNLTLWKRLKLAILGELYVRHDVKPGWTGKLPFYIVKCPRHGYFLDYPHGWARYFRCPLCKKSEQRNLSKRTENVAEVC